MSWRDIINDAREAVEEITDNVSESVENLIDEINNTDIEELLGSETFQRISSLIVGGRSILAYSLLNYIVTQAANNSSSSSGWNRAGSTLTAVGNAIENLLLINSQNNSTVTTINASNATNNLILVGNALSNIITGGSGISTLWGGGEGNNTLTGGAARDLFWYLGGGNDIVTNFLTGTANNSDVAVLVGNLLSVSRNGENISINLAG